MRDTALMATAATHQLYRALLAVAGRTAARDETADPDAVAARDRGAVSLEQVLWFVAAGVSVAIIAAILWNRIRDEANEPIETPDPLGG